MSMSDARKTYALCKIYFSGLNFIPQLRIMSRWNKGLEGRNKNGDIKQMKNNEVATLL